MASVGNLANEIMRELDIYTEDVKREIKISREEIGKEGVKQLKQTSPTLTKSYRKGWRLKKEKDRVIIHNKTDYQLTHLLEKGHANDKGGGRTPPSIHIAPAEQRVVDEYIRKVEQAIQS